MEKINLLLSDTELSFLLFTVFLFTVLLPVRLHSVFASFFHIDSNRIYHNLIDELEFIIHNH